MFADGTGTVNLPELSEGSHSLSACYEAEISTGGQPGAPFKLKSPGVYSLSYGVTVYFTIDETLPQISNVSIENKTYTTAGIPLNFTVNENDSRAKYSLDGYGNVTLAGNTTFAELSEGSHNIALYITDDAGNEAVSKIAFSVNTGSTDISSQSSQAEDSTDLFTIMLIIVVVVIIIVSLVVCYTYKRRKS